MAGTVLQEELQPLGEAPDVDTENPAVDQPEGVARAVKRILRALQLHRPPGIHLFVHHRPHRFSFGDMCVRVDYASHKIASFIVPEFGL